MTISRAYIITLERKINWRELLVKLMFSELIESDLLFTAQNYQFSTLGARKLCQICTII
jgi:hypothetical protein